SVHLSANQPVLYEAVGRVQMGTELAASNVQADAMSERALGIATSPGVVGLALGKARVVEDPTTFAKEHISVQRVGVSPVLEIAVSSTSAGSAKTIATSITNDVISFSNLAGRETDTERQEELQKQIAVIRKQQSQLIPRLVTASPGDVLSIQAQLSGLMSTQTEYQRQLSDLDLAASAAQKAVMLDPVRMPAASVPSDAAQQTVLAGLIGLLLGLGLASLLEAVRPSLASPRAIGFALDATHLADLSSTDLDSTEATETLNRLGDRIALLGRNQQVDKVFLLPVTDHDDSLAHLIAWRVQPHGRHTQHRLECAVLDNHWEEPGQHPAVVVVTRRRVRGRALQPVTTLIDALGWPVLGFVTYKPTRPWRTTSPVPTAYQPRPESMVAEPRS
ncbi:MAG: hypothetical protein ABIZ07_10900, partial [Dermatophilaceae bacterium]